MEDQIWVIETGDKDGMSSVGLLWWESEQAAWEYVKERKMTSHYHSVHVFPLTRSMS